MIQELVDIAIDSLLLHHHHEMMDVHFQESSFRGQKNPLLYHLEDD